MSPYILDENNQPKPVPLLEWGKWLQKRGNRIVRQEQVGRYFVSTVFLGLDHRFGGDGPPILWETMVFRGKKGNRKDCFQRRYTSHADAIKGHEEAVGLAVDGGPWS